MTEREERDAKRRVRCPNNSKPTENLHILRDPNEKSKNKTVNFTLGSVAAKRMALICDYVIRKTDCNNLMLSWRSRDGMCQNEAGTVTRQ